MLSKEVEVRNDELEQAEQIIIQVLEESTTIDSPRELIHRLMREGLDEDVVRAAVWYLIDRKKVQFTPDWKLRIANSGAF